MLGRCSTILVHPRENFRCWFHWSSGLLHTSLSFPSLSFSMLDGHSTRPRSPKPTTHSRASAVQETLLMRHPNKWAHWSNPGSRGRCFSPLLHLADPREQPAPHPPGEQSHRQGLYHILGTREPQGCLVLADDGDTATLASMVTKRPQTRGLPSTRTMAGETCTCTQHALG